MNFYKNIEEALSDPFCVNFFYVGDEKNNSLYIIEKINNEEVPVFIKQHKSSPVSKTFLNFKEAIEKVEEGELIGIGYSKAQMIYRVSKKNYKGDLEDKDNLNGCFQFLYHFI